MTIGTVSSDHHGTSVARAGHGIGGNLKVAYGTYTTVAGTAAADGDIIQFLTLPAGATVVGGYLYGADLDTGTEALDFDLGWAATADEVADPDGFGNLGTITGDVSVHLAVAGIWIPLQGVLMTAGPKTFTADATIQLEVNTAANNWAGGALTLVVHYLMP